MATGHLTHALSVTRLQGRCNLLSIGQQGFVGKVNVAYLQVRAVALDDEYRQVMTITGDGGLYLHNFDGEELAKYTLPTTSPQILFLGSIEHMSVFAT